MMEEGRSPAQSPIASPQHRPLLAHVQGSAVVSKIARPKNSSSPSCSPASSSSDVPPADPATPGYNRPNGGLVEGTAGNARSAYSRHPPDLEPHRPGGGTTGVVSPGLSGKSEVILDQPISSAGLGFPYATYITDTGKVTHGGYKGSAHPAPGAQGHTGSNPGGGQEETSYMCDAAPLEDGTLLPESPVSPSGDDSNQRPVFRLSDGSDYSEDYTDMTGGTLDGDQVTAPSELTSPPMNGSDMNGSSVFSDVFSDRSSDTVGTQELEDELTHGHIQQICSPPDVPKENDNVEGCEGEEDDDGLGINQSLINRVLKLDIDAANQYSTKEAEGGQADDVDVVDVLSPPLSTPEIQVEEISLQEDNLKDVQIPLKDGEEGENGKGGFYEDREFDFLKAQPKVKRSTSLKTYKTPPGTPKRKMVRFADALGLDLESVRHILNMEAPPKIPQSATRDLDLRDDSDEQSFFKTPPAGGARYLTACFPQPGSNPSFPLMVRDRKVILESSVINDLSLSVTGTIRVANITYHKKVTVRYTTNNWLTFNDINAGYVQGSNDGPTDRFSFSISLPHYFSTGSRLQFCIQYVAGGEIFWDNNHGANYIVECFARALPDSDNTWMSFL